MSDSSADRDPLDVLAEEFVARYRAGERPGVEEYAARYPELADQVRDLLPALVLIEQNAPSAPPPAAGPAPRQLGDYLILREVGRGGMGVVYEAVQQSLGRHVALKVLPESARRSPAHLERFRREARAAARLHHTNIVPVFGVGDHEGTHYYAMQFLRGHGLDAVCDEVRRLRAAPAPEPAAAGAGVVASGLLTGSFHAPPAGGAAAAETAAPAGPGDTARSGLVGQPEGRYYRSAARL